MHNTNSTFKKITSLFLSLVFVLTTFAAVDFSQSAAVEAKAEENEHFLMAYFTGNLQTEQQIRLAVSTDGQNFKPLYGGNAVLQEKSTDTNNYDGYTYTDGVRDPYIFDGHDGYYYCIATDLEATAYGFWGSQSQMVLWRSLDLINWSDAYYINIAQICNSTRGTSFSNSDFQRTWAPEVYYENGQYMIYFALAGGDYQATRMHYMITDDLMDWTHYSAPQVLYDPGYDDIDADIVKEGSTYYMFYKDETPGRSTVCLATASDYTGPYTYVGQFNTSSNTGAIEGCEVYTVGDNYYLVADRFGAAGNFAIYNMGPSLAAVAAKGSNISVSDGNPISTVEELYGFTNLTPRHGSIMHISESQYNALVAASGGVTNDDIMYNFTTAYDINATGWRYETYNDSSLKDINVMMKENGSSIKIPHDGGYATLKNTTFFVNDDDVRSMLPDDVYTVSFDYSLESAHSAPIFALGTGSGAPSANTDYVMIFGNGDIWVRKSGENSDTWVANKALTLGVTYHYDIVSDGTNITFFRDGEQIGKIAATVDFPDSGTRYAAFGFTDGHSSSGYGYGTYSHLRFRDRAVTERELHTEFGNNLIYRRDDGTSTVNDMANVLNVSHSGDHNVVDPIVSRTAASYSLAGWLNPGDAVNGNVIMGIGNNKWTPAPAGRYLAVREDGMILFNYCSGSNSGGNWSEHFVDISGAFTLSANTWSYIQINIVPISANQVKLCVWKDGVSTYSNDITLTTKIDGNNQTGNDYSYGMLGMLQLPTNYVFLGNMGVPSWWQAENDTSYVKDVRFYAQALDPANLYQEAVDNRDAAVAKEYVEQNLESYDLTASENRFTGLAYHMGDVATNGFSNVLYSTTTTEWKTCAYNSSGARNQYDNDTGHVNHLSYKMPMPTNTVLVYDGVNDAAVPVELELWSYGGWGKLGELYYKGTDINGTNFDKFILNDYWYGFTQANEDGNAYLKWVGDPNDGGFDENNYRAKNDDWNGKISGRNDIYDDTRHDGTNHMFWWNRLNYKGSGDTTNYYEHFNMITFGVFSTTDSNSYNSWTTEHVQNESSNIYVINYEPVYNAITTEKNWYTTNLKGNENLYTENSLNQWYLAVYKLLTCNPNDYKNTFSSDNVASTVTLASNEIKDAMYEYNKVNIKLRADFTELDQKYENALRIIATVGSDSQEYTTTSISELSYAISNLYYEPDDGDPYRPNVEGFASSSAIIAEKDAIDAAVTALDPIYDFDHNYNYTNFWTNDDNIPNTLSYNALYDLASEYTAKKGTDDQDRTTSSLTALENAISSLTYYNYSDKKNLGEKKDGAAIENEVVALSKKVYDLEHLLSYTTVDEAFAEGETLLNRISGEFPQYTESTVSALITAMNNAKSDATASRTTRLDNAYSSSKQTAIDDKGRSITTAISNLSSKDLDLSAYNEATSKMLNIDPDIYDYVSDDVDALIQVLSGAIKGEDVEYTDKNSVKHTIQTLNNDATASDVDSVTSLCLSSLSDHMIDYTITLEEGNYSTEIEPVVADGKYSGKIETVTARSVYKGKANTRAVITASTPETAWYMSYKGADGKTRRSKQYQGYGQEFSTSVIGNISIYAVQATNDKPNKVSIARDLGDNQSTHGISCIDFAGSSFVLPTPNIVPYYTFVNYTYNGVEYNPGDAISGITKDVRVVANYKASAYSPYAIKVTGVGAIEGNLFNDSAKYNQKIEVKDDSAYAWVETPEGGSGRIYYIGKDLTFYANDSANIQAITKAEYDAGISNSIYKVPSINLRASGFNVADAGSGKKKLTFNANYVNGNYSVVEYGILLGKETSGSMTDDDLIVENTGNKGTYNVLRAKSTKLVGANQFTIGVNTNMTGSFRYRAYLIYQDGNKLTTVYSPVINDSIS